MPTSYETSDHHPGPGAASRRPETLARLIVLGTLLLLPGCGREGADPEPDAGSTSTSRNDPDLSAADRDTSLNAIDRLLTAGRADAATTVARTLARRLPDDPHVGLALGRSLIALGSEARRDPVRGAERAEILSCEAVVAISPVYQAWRSRGAEASEARLSLGLALEGSDRLEDAIEIYREADVEVDPVSRLHLGLALLRAGRPQDARTVLIEVEARRPDDPFVVSARAEAALMLEEPEEARQLAGQAVRLDGESWPIRVRRASILRRTGDPRAAVESLLAMDESSRLEIPLLEELTEGCLALDRPDAAADAWAALSRARREDASASIGAGLRAAELYALAGRDDESSTWLEIALDLDPSDPRIDAAARRIDEIRAARTSP